MVALLRLSSTPRTPKVFLCKDPESQPESADFAMARSSRSADNERKTFLQEATSSSAKKDP